MSNKIPVLDNGYIALIESWGSDERIIESARMSTNKGFLGWDSCEIWECLGELNGTCPGYSSSLPEHYNYTCPICDNPLVKNKSQSHNGDLKLLSYLYSHKHLTPFEMCGLTLEIQAPIFVFREWHRHRTQSYNEMSARYTPLPDINYLPSVDRLLQSGGNNKQASSTGNNLDIRGAEIFRERLKNSYADAESLYQVALSNGVPKELARLCLPVARYSKMRASANLRNWLAFLTLRMDVNAQWEIRQYANEVGNIISNLFPRTWELFSNGR